MGCTDIRTHPKIQKQILTIIRSVPAFHQMQIHNAGSALFLFLLQVIPHHTALFLSALMPSAQFPPEITLFLDFSL